MIVVHDVFDAPYLGYASKSSTRFSGSSVCLLTVLYQSHAKQTYQTDPLNI